MAVPKTSVHKDHASVFGKGEVGAAGDVLAVQAKSVSTRMQPAPYQEFRRCIGIADSAHVEPPLVWG